MEFSTFLAVIAVGMNLFFSFLLCYTATASSDVVGTIGTIFYGGNWPEYPLIYRKYLLLMILRSQRPVEFTGLKVVRCNLQTFTDVSYQVLMQSVILSLKIATYDSAPSLFS